MNPTTLPYAFIAQLADQIPEIPADSIISRTVYQDAQLKVILFGFAPGQELSEHTAAKPAILHFIEGQAELSLGDDRFSAQAGTWAHMQPHLPHSIKAQTRLVMLLLLLETKE